MASVLSSVTRHEPRQGRSERRLAKFLEVAAELIEEVGFEATTMTAIAERSGTSIGGLYHYFPDKQSIAMALLNQYGEELEAQWSSVLDRAAVGREQFCQELTERMLAFAERRPAYLTLLPEQIRSSRSPSARQRLRRLMAAAFKAQKPSLPDDRALRAANVAVEIVKGMKNLYTNSSSEEKPLIAAEFQSVLSLYLGSILS